jgi:calcium-dependent protein kinase
VWSIGVIAYMLLSGTPPFYGRTDAETLNAVRLGRWQFDEYLFKPVSAEAKDFISKCLIRRPNARPSAKAALEHRWFNLLHRGQEQPQVSLQIIHRLDSYIKRTSLSKIIMDVVAHTLQPDQISDLREQFSKFDVSRSGEVTLSDLRKVMAGFQGFREEDLTLIFDKLNIDQTGKISYHEFLAATITRQNIKEENLQIAFERMSNHSDCITAADIKKLLGNTKYDVDKIMEEVGLQPDSKIRFHDVRLQFVGCFNVVRRLRDCLCWVRLFLGVPSSELLRILFPPLQSKPTGVVCCAVQGDHVRRQHSAQHGLAGAHGDAEGGLLERY